jgi:catechol 2,3-dioxygenase-like lactoylglutathione lyase family enzyme
MIDHFGITVSDIATSRAFYLQALAPLDYGVLMEVPAAVAGRDHLGFGVAPKPDFWISAADAAHPPTTPVHVCLRASSRAQVDAFHAAALAAGGRDNGAPGLRSHYHPNYYGAFVLDPDGHNVEAVCHEPV